MIEKYSTYSSMLLKLWMDDILTDSQYYHIMDKLNERKLKDDKRRLELENSLN